MKAISSAILTPLRRWKKVRSSVLPRHYILASKPRGYTIPLRRNRGGITNLRMKNYPGQRTGILPAKPMIYREMENNVADEDPARLHGGLASFFRFNVRERLPGYCRQRNCRRIGQIEPFAGRKRLRRFTSPHGYPDLVVYDPMGQTLENPASPARKQAPGRQFPKVGHARLVRVTLDQKYLLITPCKQDEVENNIPRLSLFEFDGYLALGSGGACRTKPHYGATLQTGDRGTHTVAPSSIMA